MTPALQASPSPAWPWARALHCCPSPPWTSRATGGPVRAISVCWSRPRVNELHAAGGGTCEALRSDDPRGDLQSRQPSGASLPPAADFALYADELRHAAYARPRDDPGRAGGAGGAALASRSWRARRHACCSLRPGRGAGTRALRGRSRSVTPTAPPRCGPRPRSGAVRSGEVSRGGRLDGVRLRARELQLMDRTLCSSLATPSFWSPPTRQLASTQAC